jgi:hypothetical protein
VNFTITIHFSSKAPCRVRKKQNGSNSYEAGTCFWHEMSVKNTSPKYIGHLTLGASSHCNVSGKCFGTGSSHRVIHSPKAYTPCKPHSLNISQDSIWSQKEWLVLYLHCPYMHSLYTLNTFTLVPTLPYAIIQNNLKEKKVRSSLFLGVTHSIYWSLLTFRLFDHC